MGSIVLLSALPMAPASRLASAEPPVAGVRSVVVAPQQALQSTAADQDVSGGQAYPITPERRALLNTIRYAEGTWVGEVMRDIG